MINPSHPCKPHKNRCGSLMYKQNNSSENSVTSAAIYAGIRCRGSSSPTSRLPTPDERGTTSRAANMKRAKPAVGTTRRRSSMFCPDEKRRIAGEALVFVASRHVSGELARFSGVGERCRRMVHIIYEEGTCGQKKGAGGPFFSTRSSTLAFIIVSRLGQVDILLAPVKPKLDHTGMAAGGGAEGALRVRLCSAGAEPFLEYPSLKRPEVISFCWTKK